MRPDPLEVVTQAAVPHRPCSRGRETSPRGLVARDRLIVALDVPTADAALAIVDALTTTCIWFKVGLELFYAAGPAIVKHLRDRQLNVFLDLKLHDIPNTVASAIHTLSRLDVQLLTVHASGGTAMLAAAQRAASDLGALQLLGVTVLTSMDEQQLAEVGVVDEAAGQVQRLARLTQRAGLPGVVCSSLEVTSLRATLGPDALLVVPGIRPDAAPVDDQKRVATPTEAIQSGASMLVVGRPITRAANPGEAASAVLREIELALLAMSAQMG